MILINTRAELDSYLVQSHNPLNVIGLIQIGGQLLREAIKDGGFILNFIVDGAGGEFIQIDIFGSVIGNYLSY